MSRRDGESPVEVLDRGYVRLRQSMGDDLTPVDAARVSHDRRTEWDEVDGQRRMKPGDRRLLRFLFRHRHTSPLRHSALTFEVYAPLEVMRQWGKYRVGSSWTFEDSDDPLEAQNESSRRYVTETPEFYLPTVWRSAPESRKQGSGPPVDDATARRMTAALREHVASSVALYSRALDAGVAPEQARLFLPAYALYVRAWWTVSLQGALHFLRERLGRDAQEEIRDYALGVYDLVGRQFPLTVKSSGMRVENGALVEPENEFIDAEGRRWVQAEEVEELLARLALAESSLPVAGGLRARLRRLVGVADR